ncbi:hypothetical protein MYX06_00075 [Patescibacteria group bacterium AH-259-L05]|nr:hypothetical protein [Patescibacteria group bacterium AH-259-L05]
MKSENKTCQNCKQQFIIEPDDFNFYKKMDVSLPTFCPQCRYQRRLANRNEWHLYQRTCDFTGEIIVSIYRDEAPFPVYKQDVWKSDKWDAVTYGREFDFSRPFFEQFKELRDVVPHLALVNSNSVNSQYSNQSQDNKDCYMVSATGDSEKCMYGNWYQLGCYLCADCYNLEACELCYECLNCARCFSCAFSQDCYDCSYAYFSKDCRGCDSVFGCIGLRNKKYCFFNKQLSKEEYQKRVQSFSWSHEAITKVRKTARKLWMSSPYKFYHGNKNKNSSGDYLESTKSTRLSFNCRHNEDTAYLQDAWQIKDCLDMTEILDAELSYETQGCAHLNRCVGLRSCWTLTDCYYCDLCFTGSYLFGCMGLKQKQYCILNKQYLKEEYFDLRDKIISHMKRTGEWGEFFPSDMSPFAYNESVLQDYFPLTQKEAQQKGYTWYNRGSRDYKIDMIGSQLPRTIQEVNQKVLHATIQCVTQEDSKTKKKYPLCTTAFKFTSLELTFYKKMNLPLPRKCFPCRRQDRFALRNPRKLWHRACQCIGERSNNKVYTNAAKHFHGSDHCPSEFETTYSPERKEVVYCEKCYQQEVA